MVVLPGKVVPDPDSNVPADGSLKPDKRKDEEDEPLDVEKYFEKYI